MKLLNIPFRHRFYFLCCLTSVIYYSQFAYAADPFPAFPEIEANIVFWKKVYSRYSTTQAILHDSTELDIIYEIVELEPPITEAGKKINKKRIDNAKRYYRQQLQYLANHPKEMNPELKRIAELFGPDANRRRYIDASRRIRSQIGQKDRFRQGIIRSGAYMEAIKKIFAEYGLPESLSILPHVESSFDIHARSKYGALGMWQFTRTTGRRFLTINRTKDERLDFTRSTHAAARLLKENYEKLKNWPMALTAYNHGAAGMQRAKRKKSTYEKIFTSYRSRTFGFASRNFYSEFIAAREIIKNHEDYFGELTLAKPEKKHSWKLPVSVAAADIADHMGISLESFQRLNPSYTDAIFSGTKNIPKNHIIYLPIRPGLRLPGLTASLSSKLLAKAQDNTAAHMVKKGDTAGNIAHNYGVRLADLIQTNNLDKNATIFIGQKLNLPVKKKGRNVITAGRRAKKETTVRDLSPTMMASAARASKPSEITNTVGHLSDIKVRGTTMADGIRMATIEVLPDETLGHYAGWIGADISTIREINELHHNTVIRLHQNIRIPIDKTSIKTFERRRAAFHRKIREVFFNKYRVEDTVHYYVKQGDSVWELSNEVFGVPMWLLSKYNPHVDFSALKKAQKLLIPKVENII